MPALLVKPLYYAQYYANYRLTVLCIYASAVCASDNDGAIVIVEPTQPTEPRFDRPQCSILEKLNPPTKSDLVRKRKTELRIINLRGLTRNLRSINY